MLKVTIDFFQTESNWHIATDILIAIIKVQKQGLKDTCDIPKFKKYMNIYTLFINTISFCFVQK